jgi:polynucleotide 5'-hydroxyl-kinase GRC3/NOL9
MRNQPESADTRGITVPKEWHRLPLEEFLGVVMVIGANDSGKSTLVRWLVGELEDRGRSTAWLDGDIGQAELGVPGTMTLRLPISLSSEQDRIGFFVGSTSPRGHMLPMLVGVRKLLDRSGNAGAEVTVMDTTGMVRGQAGAALKEWKIQMARPDVLIAVQREDELEPILRPLRSEEFVRVHLLPVSPHARARVAMEREEHRRRQYRQEFQGSILHRIEIGEVPLYGRDAFEHGSLVGLLDAEGFCPAVGVLHGQSDAHWTVRSSHFSMEWLRGIRVGQVRVDPDTGVEIRSRSSG